MLQIMIACTRNGRFVPTGIETDIDTFIALPEALSLTRCPACGGNHYWTKSQTWICNIESSSRALLPAGSSAATSSWASGRYDIGYQALTCDPAAEPVPRFLLAYRAAKRGERIAVNAKCKRPSRSCIELPRKLQLCISYCDLRFLCRGCASQVSPAPQRAHRSRSAG